MTLDDQLREQILFESYKSTGFIDVQNALLQSMDILEKKILRLGDNPVRKKLVALYDEIYSQVANAYKPLPAQMIREGAAATRLIYLANAGKSLPLAPIKAALSNDLTIQGYDFSELMKTTSLNHARQLKTLIASHIASGSSLSTIVRAMRSKNSKLTKSQLRSSINTTIAEARAKARYAAYEDMEDDDTGYEYSATLDSRTSEICRGYDGRKWHKSIKEVNPKPPLHFNCRSVLVPIVKGYEPISRASIFGPVDPDMNYNTWLKSQSPTFQKKVLGSKYKAYAAGTMSSATLMDTISRDSMSLDDISASLSPVAYDGYRSAESQAWVSSSFTPLAEGGIAIGLPKVTKTSDGFGIFANSAGFDYVLLKKKKEALLKLIEIPQALRGKGLGTEMLKSLKAVSDAGKVKLVIDAGSTDYVNGVFTWLSTGLTRPENISAFNKTLLGRLSKELDYDSLSLFDVEKMLQSGAYEALLKDKTYGQDIKEILSGLNLRLVVV